METQWGQDDTPGGPPEGVDPPADLSPPADGETEWDVAPDGTESAEVGEESLSDAAPDVPPWTAPGTSIDEASVDEVEAVLDQVDRALARLDDGSYGRCEGCGQPIDDDLLAEDPTRRTCQECLVPVLSEID
jgi:RNA polymerase-binding transcription factor DksA